MPSIQPIAPATIPAGSSLLIPIVANSPEGRSLSYSVSTGHPRLTATVLRTNLQLRLDVEGHGALTFQLLPEFAPETVRHIGGLAASGFYDGITFHRIIAGFMVQGGDPTGTGGGGPGFKFDDEFHQDAVFTGTAQLAMANSGRDSNGSQFFITVDGPKRFLDFNHAIFGQLIRGADVLKQIAAVPTSAGDRPVTPVVIRRAGFVPNQTDAVLLLRADSDLNGVTSVTVWVDDGQRGSDQEVFEVTIAAETYRDPPFFEKIDTTLVTPKNVPVTFELKSWEKPGEAVQLAVSTSPTNVLVTADGEGNITVTPPAEYIGRLLAEFRIRLADGTARGSSMDPWDRQLVVIGVGEIPITGEGLVISGAPGVNLESEPVARFSYGTTASDPARFSAFVNWGDGTVNEGEVSSLGMGQFEVRGSHQYARSGLIPVTVYLGTPDGSRETVKSVAVIAPELVVGGDEGELVVAAPSWAREYQLQAATSLAGAFTNVTAAGVIDEFSRVWRFPRESPSGFYRLKSTAPVSP